MAYAVFDIETRIDKSLVNQVGASTSQSSYGLLETVRLYAQCPVEFGTEILKRNDCG